MCWGSKLVEWAGFGQTDAPAGQYTAIDARWVRTCAVSVEGEIVCWTDTDYELQPIPSLYGRGPLPVPGEHSS